MGREGRREEGSRGKGVWLGLMRVEEGGRRWRKEGCKGMHQMMMMMMIEVSPGV